MTFETVNIFENKIAEFFNAPFCVSTDSCTHAIELCLRLKQTKKASSPYHTYISVPFTFEKLALKWQFKCTKWQDYYYITTDVIDAAVYWKKNGYIQDTYMCVSFQYKKHLGLGRGGAILLDSKQDYEKLKKMSYDGRLTDVPWAKQNIDTVGYHYYMTPETAELGLKKLPTAICTKPITWCWKDYPDLSTMEIFSG